tara:strand:+ start:222 stop:515 length:294 start_codon:yes stop_codon:yes gene_type:complete
MSLPTITDLTTEVIIDLIKSGAFTKDSTYFSRNKDLVRGLVVDYLVEYIDFDGDVDFITLDVVHQDDGKLTLLHESAHLTLDKDLEDSLITILQGNK